MPAVRQPSAAQACVSGDENALCRSKTGHVGNGQQFVPHFILEIRTRQLQLYIKKFAAAKKILIKFSDTLFDRR